MTEHEPHEEQVHILPEMEEQTSCLLIVSDKLQDVDFRMLASTYYELEEQGILVNFASPSGVSASDLKQQEQACVDTDDDFDELIHRFIGDKVARERLGRAISLNNAVMMTGISYDGIAFFGHAVEDVRSCKKVRAIAQTMVNLGRVLCGFGKGMVLLADTYKFNQEGVSLLEGVQICHYLHTTWAKEQHQSSTEAYTTYGELISSKEPIEGSLSCFRDGTIVTASGEKESITKAPKLLGEALKKYREEAEKFNRHIGFY